MRFLRVLLCCMGIAATLQPAGALDAVGEGRRAWLRYNCYGCHGGNGAGGMGPNVQHESFSDVSGAMRGGERDGGMISFTSVTSNDPNAAYNISQYLASIGSASEPKWLDRWNVTPAK